MGAGWFACRDHTLLAGGMEGATRRVQWTVVPTENWYRFVQQTLALTWQLSEIHGWGLVGVHTALHLVEQGHPPLLLEKPALSTLRQENRERLQFLADGYQKISSLSTQHRPRVLQLNDCNVLHALGNGFVAGPPSSLFRGSRNVGVIAFENTLFDAEVTRRARSYDKLVVHSTFNKTLLADQGIDNVACSFQGVDPGELVPVPAAKRFGDRFVIFSGGKVEFRKAQDIVLAAFSRFHARHPDALLITAWHNPWPATAVDISESGLIQHPPVVAENGKLRIVEWAMAHNVPPDAFVDMGFLGRSQIAAVLAECHAAIFPNRCEGATNLVAMETMACGVPVILSGNTGHLDLIHNGNCLVLSDQTPVPDPTGCRQGWGESSVEEAVEHLETLYTDRAVAKTHAERGSAFIREERTWRRFAESFVEAVQ